MIFEGLLHSLFRNRRADSHALIPMALLLLYLFGDLLGALGPLNFKYFGLYFVWFLNRVIELFLELILINILLLRAFLLLSNSLGVPLLDYLTGGVTVRNHGSRGPLLDLALRGRVLASHTDERWVPIVFHLRWIRVVRLINI